LGKIKIENRGNNQELKIFTKILLFSWILYFFPLGATALGELWPPE
jgi:hypothetical protein